MNKNIENKIFKGLVIFLAVQLIIMIGLIIILLSCKNFNARGRSMAPYIKDGDALLCTTLYFDIKKGDIVGANPKNDNDDCLIAKRVVATEGDHVYMHDGHLYINDIEDTIDPNAIYDAEIDLVVPDNSFYILGDNRNVSKDSRTFGCITKDEIVSKVIKIK